MAKNIPEDCEDVLPKATARAFPTAPLYETQAYMWTYQYLQKNGRQYTSSIPSLYTPEEPELFIDWIESAGGNVLKIKSIKPLYYGKPNHG